jgi:hypothetical protein
MSEIDYAARVAKGAALLDEKRPGWERLIDLDILDIENGHCCVTAQLSGTNAWYAGQQQLGLTTGDDGTYVAHGFNAEADGEPDSDAQAVAYDTLNTLWKDLISKRLAPEPADG